MVMEPGVLPAAAEGIPPAFADSGKCRWPGQGPSAAPAGAAVPERPCKVGMAGRGESPGRAHALRVCVWVMVDAVSSGFVLFVLGGIAIIVCVCPRRARGV